MQQKQFSIDFKDFFFNLIWILKHQKNCCGTLWIYIGAKHCQEWLDAVDLAAGVGD